MEPPFKPRQFVWCQFPYMEQPLRPGPKEHVGYVADIRQINGSAHLTVMSIYTTTTQWEPGARASAGHHPCRTGDGSEDEPERLCHGCPEGCLYPGQPRVLPASRRTWKGDRPHSLTAVPPIRSKHLDAVGEAT
jgi:hypothetical protein